MYCNRGLYCNIGCAVTENCIAIRRFVGWAIVLQYTKVYCDERELGKRLCRNTLIVLWLRLLERLGVCIAIHLGVL